jgi:hypothetical protein
VYRRHRPDQGDEDKHDVDRRELKISPSKLERRIGDICDEVQEERERDDSADRTDQKKIPDVAE